MSKVIKQMQMDAIRQTFDGVRDMVVLSIQKLDCHAGTIRCTSHGRPAQKKGVGA